MNIPACLEQARLLYAPTSPSLLTVYADDTAEGWCPVCSTFILRTTIQRQTTADTSFGQINCTHCSFPLMIYREPAY